MTKTENFDYVIVGGGSAGAVLAARLSENPDVSVCLIEAGGAGNSIFTRVPLAALAQLPYRLNNWSFHSVPQKHLNGRVTYQPRGRVLGGSSQLNAMLYVRGQREDYDSWRDAGCAGWGWDDVHPYFLKSENNQRGADADHGVGGPLHVSDQARMRPISEAFLEAAQANQIPFREDFNRGQNEGVAPFQVTQFHDAARKGTRASTKAAFLTPIMERQNLTIKTQARALKVEFDGTRARRVVAEVSGRVQTVTAEHEIVLCAGAFQSPHLLMLSGVGPNNTLRGHGIETVSDLPGVGQNLQDHLDVILGYKSHDPQMLGLSVGNAAHIIAELFRYRRTGEGLAATPAAEIGAFFKSGPEVDRADIQLHFIIGLVDEHARKLHFGSGYSCHACVLRPGSRGYVGLASSDPKAAPLIDPNYLSDPEDLEKMVRAVKRMHAIMHTDPIKGFIKREMWVPENPNDDDWRAFIRARAETIYHPVGTCKMGVDDMAVVDTKLRVKGVEGLRVVDASVIPMITSGNTNAPVIMFAERAAEFMAANQ